MHLVLRTKKYRGHIQVDRLTDIPKRTDEAIDTLPRGADSVALSTTRPLLTLSIWAEQGLGDALQSVSLIPEVVCRVPQLQRGNPIYCAFVPLGGVVRRGLSAHDVKVVPHEVPRLPKYNFHMPVGSLPLTLGVTLDKLA